MQHRQFQVQVNQSVSKFNRDRYPVPCTDDRDRDEKFRERHDRDEESDPVIPEVYLVDSVD